MEAGIYTPVNNDSIIEFTVSVSYMYMAYEDYPFLIKFAVAPKGDPAATKESARFNLRVETIDKTPMIYFVMADVGENNGVKLGTQHYEYGNTYTIRFELSGNTMRVYINNVKQDEELFIPTGQKVFYIGYSLPMIAGADVEISDITVDGVAK